MKTLMIGILLWSLSTSLGASASLLTSPERQRETLRGAREIAISFSAGAPEVLSLLSDPKVLEALLRNRLRESGIVLLEGRVSGSKQAIQSAVLHVAIQCNDLPSCNSLHAEIEVQQYVSLTRDSAVSFMAPTFVDRVYSSHKIKSPLEAESVARQLVLDAARIFINAYYSANKKNPQP